MIRQPPRTTRTDPLFPYTAPLSTILSEYILGLESLYRGMYCSILGVHNNRLVSWVATSLPDSYIATVHDLTISDQVGSCGTPAYRKERVIGSDIAAETKWATVKDKDQKMEVKEKRGS